MPALPARAWCGMNDMELAACSLFQPSILQVTEAIASSWAKSVNDAEQLQGWAVRALLGHPHPLLQGFVARVVSLLECMASFHSEGLGEEVVSRARSGMQMFENSAVNTETGDGGRESRGMALERLMDTLVDCTIAMLSHVHVGSDHSDQVCLGELSPPPFCVREEWESLRKSISSSLSECPGPPSSCASLGAAVATMGCKVAGLLDGGAQLVCASRLLALALDCGQPCLFAFIRRSAIGLADAWYACMDPRVFAELCDEPPVPVGPDATPTELGIWATKRWLKVCRVKSGQVNVASTKFLASCITWLVVSSDRKLRHFPEVLLCCKAAVDAARVSAERDVSVLRALVTMSDNLYQRAMSLEFFTRTLRRMRRIAAMSLSGGEFIDSVAR